MKRMMMVAAVMLYMGGVHAEDLSPYISPLSSWEGQSRGIIDISAHREQHSLERDGWEIVDGRCMEAEEKKEKRTFLKTAGMVILGGASVTLCSVAFAPCYWTIGIYEGLKFLGMGMFRSAFYAGSITSLASNFSGTCYTVGGLGLGVVTDYFWGSEKR